MSTSLRKDKFKIVYDNDIEQLMDNIDCESVFCDPVLTDDGYGGQGLQTEDYLKTNHPLPWAVLNNVSLIISKKYLETEWPNKTPLMIEHKLNEGRNSGNTKWHCDKEGGDYGVFADIDVICLYYFNTLNQGPICVKDTNTGEIIKHYPKKGSMIILNEIDCSVLHKIEDYDWQNNKRYTARLGFKLQ